MKKMRSKLATHAKVQLKPASARTALQEVIKRDTEPASTLLKTQWEDDMINKYQDLFQFPLNTDVTNQDIMLLVLSYQMNTIRCWCALKNGALAKVNNHTCLVVYTDIFIVAFTFFNQKTWKFL